MHLDLSPFFSPVCEYSSTPLYVLSTRLMNHTTCNVESRALTCWISIDRPTGRTHSWRTWVNFAKNEYSREAVRTRCKHARGLLRHSRGRGARWGSFGPRGDPHRKLAQWKLKNTSEKSWGAFSEQQLLIAAFLYVYLPCAKRNDGTTERQEMPYHTRYQVPRNKQ